MGRQNNAMVKQEQKLATFKNTFSQYKNVLVQIGSVMLRWKVSLKLQ